MGYYCNICKKSITRAEFFYSKDHFDRPLCREHQELERRAQEKANQLEHPEGAVIEQGPNIEEISGSEEVSDSPKKSRKSRGKKVVLAIGRGAKKGVKKMGRSLKKTYQKRKWKGAILRRMTMSQLQQLCFEKNVSTKKEVLIEDEHSDEEYWKEVNCSESDLVSELKDKASLDAIISFAKRNTIDIREILDEIAQKKANWEKKELIDKLSKKGNTVLLEVVKAISNFVPLRQYNKEISYQDTLANWLKPTFPDTTIEESRGSSRPDIVVQGIAIEVKGPTSYRDLDSLANKCLRYPQSFPNGMICVLFKVNVSERRYREWLEGMNKKHPEIVIIKI